MDIFASNPRIFSLDRKSPQASELKQSVMEKLFEFLGNYSDDVLAEYIVVLVCNGKHQNQAKDDLEAFLGNDSTKFIAWLWDNLSENVPFSETSCRSSSLRESTLKSSCSDDTSRDQRTSRSRVAKVHMTGVSNDPVSKDGRNMCATFSPKLISSNDKEVAKEFHRWSPDSEIPLTDLNIEEMGSQPKNGTSGNRTWDDYSGALRYRSSRVLSKPEVSVGSEQSLQYEDQSMKKAISKINGFSPQLLHSPKREPVLSNQQSSISDNPLSRTLPSTNAFGTRVPSRVLDAPPRHNARPRGNVWDRLGKPCEENGVEENTVIKMCVMPDGRAKRKLQRETPLHGQSSGMAILNNLTDGSRIVEPIVSKIVLDDEDNSRQKRQHTVISNLDGLTYSYNNKGTDIQHKVLERLERPSAKYRLSQRLNGIASDGRSTDGPLSGSMDISLKSPSAGFCPGSRKVDQAKLHSEASVAAPLVQASLSNALLTKPESLCFNECEHASLKPVEVEVLNVRLRLQQMEMEMNKLRSKQEGANYNVNPSVPLGSGAQNHPEEDIEPRTVFVTNVHFAVTKEALSSHFSKCGVVVKAILLTDTVTGQPKGSAYVVFGCKESADKAVLLSGTSFFSRTLKVVHKADMPALTSAPVQPAVRPSQSWVSQKKDSLSQKPYSSLNLKWQRQQPSVTADNSQAAMAGVS